MLQSDLETNRASELDKLLKLVTPKILDLIERSEINGDKYDSQSLGSYHSPQFLKDEFSAFNNDFSGIKGHDDKLQVLLDKVLQYSVNTWNPGFLDKLYASNNPIGVVSDMILSVLNTNSHVFTVSPVLSVLENFIGKAYGKLFYNNETCGGLTFSGGSWSNVTSLQMARSLLYPDTKINGNGSYKFAVYTSKHCHYSVEKAAMLLGLGSANVFKVDVNPDGTMKYEDLEATVEDSIIKGFTPLYISSTAGTTVFGSFDNFVEINKVAKKYKIWFHIDGSWGGNVIFSEKQKYRLNGCELSDSITVNPHKMLGVPTTCSFLLVSDVANFQKSMSLSAPYLFHGRENGEENFDLADGTMGCGRRADSFKFYMAWKYYGTKGFEQRVDHAYAIVDYFKQQISQNPNFSLVVQPDCLQVCFYFKPSNYELSDFTPITRFISRELHRKGKYLMDFSPNPHAEEDHGEFFRVVFNSPILTDKVIDELIGEIIATGEEFMQHK